uniref:Uncharacterized protein n=1 Tax=Clytia hemisphaerica TaxID=252671 RepID=A0A7M6DIV5_9CNID
MSLITEEEFNFMTHIYEERMAISQFKEMHRRMERAAHFGGTSHEQEIYDKESEIGKIRYLIRRMELTRAYYHQLANKGLPFNDTFLTHLKLAHTFLQNQQRLRREELKTLQQEPVKVSEEPENQEPDEEFNELQLPLTKSAKRRLRRMRLKNQKSEENEVADTEVDAVDNTKNNS